MIDKIKAEIIAKKYYKDIYSYCLSNLNCNEDDASEVTQKVFLLFQEKCEGLEDGNIRGWLYRVAKNKIKEQFREVKKEELYVPLEEDMLSMDEDEAYRTLDEAFNLKDEEIEKYKDIVLKTLTKKEQELYRKIYIEKKKHKEIAEELNITENAVSVRAYRLNNKIKTTVKLMFTSVGQFIIKLFF